MRSDYIGGFEIEFRGFVCFVCLFVFFVLLRRLDGRVIGRVDGDTIGRDRARLDVNFAKARHAWYAQVSALNDYSIVVSPRWNALTLKLSLACYSLLPACLPVAWHAQVSALHDSSIFSPRWNALTLTLTLVVLLSAACPPACLPVAFVLPTAAKRTTRGGRGFTGSSVRLALRPAGQTSPV